MSRRSVQGREVVSRKSIERRVSVTKDRSLESGVITTGDGCWQAYLAEEVCRSRKPDFVARSFGKPKLAEDPWACWAYSCWVACEGSGACQVGCPGEGGVGWGVLRETRLGRRHQHRSHCLESARERSGMPDESQYMLQNTSGASASQSAIRIVKQLSRT
jgi:hypothetical protein